MLNAYELSASLLRRKVKTRLGRAEMQAQHGANWGRLPGALPPGASHPSAYSAIRLTHTKMGVIPTAGREAKFTSGSH